MELDPDIHPAHCISVLDIYTLTQIFFLNKIPGLLDLIYHEYNTGNWS